MIALIFIFLLTILGFDNFLLGLAFQITATILGFLVTEFTERGP